MNDDEYDDDVSVRRRAVRAPVHGIRHDRRRAVRRHACGLLLAPVTMNDVSARSQAGGSTRGRRPTGLNDGIKR